MIFPILTRWRALNLPPFNSYPCFLHVRHAANSWELNDLRIQTSCLGEFHRRVSSEESFQ